MVKGLRPSVLEQCLGRLVLGICKVGAPFGVSLAMRVMEKTPPKKLQLEIVDRCMAHRMREGIYSTYILGTVYNLMRCFVEIRMMTNESLI